MRNILLLFALLWLFSCKENKKATIQFKPVSENELNFLADTTFSIPHGKIWDERKRLHDSCMGSSYAVNAVFIRTKDSIPIGSIVDRRTMKVVDRFPLFGDSSKQFSSLFAFEITDCHEKRPIDVPIDSFMNNQFPLKVDSSNSQVNGELINAIKSAISTEVEMGSWLNLELNNGLGKLLDTTTDRRLLRYRKALLDSNNMLLVRSSSVEEINFYIRSKNALPNDLLNVLMTKPVAIKQPFFELQFFYLNNTSFKLKLTGYFQLLGQFMKCTL